VPDIEVNGVTLHCTEAGEGERTLVFSHGYLMNSRMFAHQIEALARDYRVIAFDHRGHGASQRAPEPFGIYDLVDDAAALIDALVGGPVHFIGMSTGGYVGLRLMVRRPELLRSVTLIDTAADAEDPAGLRQYDLLLFVARWFGLRPVYSRAVAILMGEPFRTDPARRAEYDAWRAEILALDRRSITNFGKAIFYRDDVVDAVRGSAIPAQVIVGELDVPTPPARARQIHELLADSRLDVIPGAGHTSPVERPEEVTRVITRFLAEVDA
jgi:pimeloyl-ACP methyl ester carboxylesterase